MTFMRSILLNIPQSTSSEKTIKKGGLKMFYDVRSVRMAQSRFLTGIIALLIFSALLFTHQTVVASSGAKALVETSWLADNLKKSNVQVVFIGDPSPQSKAGFDSKHIPNAVFLGAASLLKNFNPMGGTGEVPDKAKWEAIMGELGIKNDTHVILHSTSGHPFVSRAFWLMEYYGHKNVSVLNGGIAKWVSENRETVATPTKVTPAKYTAAPDASVIADADEVLKNTKNPKVAIIDTRAPEEYSGANAMGNKRTGHIPGAILLNFFPTNRGADGNFKSVNELKAAYEAKGITKDKEIITYCQAGVRAADTYFVLKHILGYPKVKNYANSIGEWANNLDPAKYPLAK